MCRPIRTRNRSFAPHARPFVAVLRTGLEDLAALELGEETIEDDLRHAED